MKINKATLWLLAITCFVIIGSFVLGKVFIARVGHTVTKDHNILWGEYYSTYQLRMEGMDIQEAVQNSFSAARSQSAEQKHSKRPLQLQHLPDTVYEAYLFYSDTRDSLGRYKLQALMFQGKPGHIILIRVGDTEKDDWQLHTAKCKYNFPVDKLLSPASLNESIASDPLLKKIFKGTTLMGVVAMRNLLNPENVDAEPFVETVAIDLSGKGVLVRLEYFFFFTSNTSVVGHPDGWPFRNELDGFPTQRLFEQKFGSETRKI